MIEIFWRHKSRSRYTICSEAIYADIETSHSRDYSHTWMVSCQLKFAGTYKLVRTPSEFIEYLREKTETFHLDQNRRIAVYFHNASFDLNFLLPYIQLMLPGYETSQGLYDGRNRIITYQQGAFEFRCSYLLSSCSLEKWGEEMNAEHRKKVGLYDYDKLVFQDSEIDENSAIYDEYDVLCMEDCMRKQLEASSDNLATVPLTSTGYPRRMLRRSCTTTPSYRSEVFLRSQLTADAFERTISSYAGGYTHMNRYYKGMTAYPAGKYTIKHRDFRSHYPSQLRKYPLPWGNVDLYYDIADKKKDIRIEDLFAMWPEYTTITTIRIKDMRLRSAMITMPFMQLSKMEDKSPGFKVLNDNGRALRTEGIFTTNIDNLTLKIISEQYKFDYQILKVYRMKNTECPKCVADIVDDLFKKKSDYKIEYNYCRDEYGENDERTIDALFRLNQVKKLLNSIYGCLATSPVRDDDTIDFVKFYTDPDCDDPYIHIHPNTLEEKQQKLDRYYGSKNSFLPYQVGCMITALARYELYEYINAIGYDNCLYGDTDSLFYISTPEIEERIAALNAEKNKTAPYIINSKGEKVYYDVFEDEPDLLAFRGLHSKCYAVVQKNKKTGKPELVATIAGVPRRTIIAMKGEKPIYLTREEELAGITKELKLKKKDKYDPFDAINNLEIGFKFHVNTGFTAKYIREPELGLIEVDGHMVETAGGCVIRRLDEKLVTDNNIWEYDVEFSEVYIEGL